MNEEAFKKGFEAFKAEDYRGAVREFQKSIDSIDEQHENYNRIASYLGLSQVMTLDRNGLLLCRDAASSEVLDGDVFLNLACAEWHSLNRKRSVDAVMRGCKIDCDHKQIKRACSLLDSRKRSVFPFLSREHVLNKLVGRILRRSRGEITVRRLLY